MKKKMTAIVMCICILAGMITGCNASEQKETEARTKKEITIAVNSETGGMDPAGNIALTYLSYSVTALDELLTFDENGEIECRAAQSYEVNEDSTEWTFHLREGGCWSDGTPVTSADFKNTIVRALDPKSEVDMRTICFRSNMQRKFMKERPIWSLGVETPDENTLIFHLSKPCVYFLSFASSGLHRPAVNMRKRRAADGIKIQRPVCQTTVLSGKICTGAIFCPEKNERYWNADAVHLERITHRFLKNSRQHSAYETKESMWHLLPSVVHGTKFRERRSAVTVTISRLYLSESGCEASG